MGCASILLAPCNSRFGLAGPIWSAQTMGDILHHCPRHWLYQVRGNGRTRGGKPPRARSKNCRSNLRRKSKIGMPRAFTIVCAKTWYPHIKALLGRQVEPFIRPYSFLLAERDSIRRNCRISENLPKSCRRKLSHVDDRLQRLRKRKLGKNLGWISRGKESPISPSLQQRTAESVK